MKTLQPLLLIRHGQAEHQIKEITGGWSDTSLTPLGEQQAAWLGARLRDELDGTAFTLGASSLKRARQTARIIGEALRLEPQIYPDLTDLNNGAAAGKSHAEAKALARPISQPWVDWRPYPQAETWRELHSRISTFMEQFTATQAVPAILVTHFAIIDLMVSWWLQLDIESPTHFEIAPASLTVLTISKYGERAVERLNDTAHLYAQGIKNPMVLSSG
jgi:broad specificity phosphatase PhoE